VYAFPTEGQWIAVTIDQNSGLFWATGGFGQPGSGGGSPLWTLAEWLTVFDSGFGEAEMLRVSVGVGSSNQGQLGYFDDVLISHRFGDGYSASHDFEAEPQLPSALGWGLFSLTILLLAGGSLLLRASAIDDQGGTLLVGLASRGSRSA